MAEYMSTEDTTLTVEAIKSRMKKLKNMAKEDGSNG
jgi:hypothetical protein